MPSGISFAGMKLNHVFRFTFFSSSFTSSRSIESIFCSASVRTALGSTSSMRSKYFFMSF